MVSCIFLRRLKPPFPHAGNGPFRNSGSAPRKGILYVGASGMFDPDSGLLVFLLILVIALLIFPPGPGTPLKSPVR